MIRLRDIEGLTKPVEQKSADDVDLVTNYKAAFFLRLSFYHQAQALILQTLRRPKNCKNAQ